MPGFDPDQLKKWNSFMWRIMRTVNHNIPDEVLDWFKNVINREIDKEPAPSYTVEVVCKECGKKGTMEVVE